MKRRLMCLALAALMTISAAGCRGSEPAASSSAPEAPAASSEAPAESSGSEAPAAPAENFKIGIITGTASQGDEEITQANKMKEKYGDMIVTSTYPDNFDK